MNHRDVVTEKKVNETFVCFVTYKTTSFYLLIRPSWCVVSQILTLQGSKKV